MKVIYLKSKGTKKEGDIIDMHSHYLGDMLRDGIVKPYIAGEVVEEAAKPKEVKVAKPKAVKK